MDLHKQIAELKATAAELREFSYPNVSPDSEREIFCLKQREVVVDGYHAIWYFSQNEYTDYIASTFQTNSSQGFFLPFQIVCNSARNFLSGDYIYYVPIIVNEKKVYTWIQSIAKKDNSPTKVPMYENTELCDVMGFKFYKVLSFEGNYFI